jgi:hypothetical protein
MNNTTYFGKFTILSKNGKKESPAMIEQCKQCLEQSILRVYALHKYRYIVKVKGVHAFVDISGILNELLTLLKVHDCYLYGMMIVAQDVGSPVLILRADESTEIIQGCYETVRTVKEQSEVILCIQLFNENGELEDEAFVPKGTFTQYQFSVVERMNKVTSYGSIVFLWLQEFEFAQSVAETWKLNMGWEDKQLMGSLHPKRLPHDPTVAYVLFKGQCKFV